MASFTALVCFGGIQPCLAAAEILRFNLTEGRAVIADPRYRDPRDGRSILVYFQKGRLFQGREPSQRARFCRFFLDPAKRPIDDDGEPPTAYFLMPGQIRFRVRSAYANGNRSLDLTPIAPNESHLVKIHCEDPTESEAFADPKSFASVLQGVWGDWMAHVPAPPAKEPGPGDCGIRPIPGPFGDGQLKAFGEIITRSAEPPAAEQPAAEASSTEEPDPSVFDSPGASETWEEMQESFQESLEEAASGESAEESPSEEGSSSGAGPSSGESEPLRCDSPPTGEQTPAAILAEEILTTDPTVTMYLNLIRLGVLTNPADSRVGIWQILGRQAYKTAVNDRILAMTPEGRRDLFQQQLDYLREVDLYYLACENAGGKP